MLYSILSCGFENINVNYNNGFLDIDFNLNRLVCCRFVGRLLFKPKIIPLKLFVFPFV